MRVSNIRVIEGDAFCELRADVKFDTHWVWGDDPFSLWYRFPVEYAPYLSSENGDPFIAALLPPAMRLGESLTIEASVSAKLLEAIPQIQAIYRCWDKAYADTIVESRGQRKPEPGYELPSRIGLFFSMGVDSSYSLCKNLAEARQGTQITHLIVVNGFDVYLWEEQRFPPFLDAVNRVAAELGKVALPVTTNLRDVSDRIVDWVRAYHGPALASVVLALGGAIQTAYISAGQTFAKLIPRGAHPLLDPLWGTEQVHFIHYGLEADRMAKIGYLSRAPVLLQNLRVCASCELDDVYNCGRCEKCVRTMIALHAAGLLRKCISLPPEIDLELVRSLQVENPVARETLIELAHTLGPSDNDRQLQAALLECLERHAALEATTS